MPCTIGVDFGTNSVRAVVADCADGRILGTGVTPYPSGDLGILLDPADPHLARQHPGDYVVGLQDSITTALREAKVAPADIVGIGIDTTGSTPMPVDAQNRPLGLDPRWEGHLAAHAWLWKDHTGAAEAAEITALARELAPEHLAVIGGVYSSEWFWAKILKCRRVAPDVFAAAHSWVEIADWIPSVLTGATSPDQILRGICAAGHKAMFSDAWGGLPSEEFLARLDPALAELRGRLFDEAYAADRPAGHLCAEWAAKLGLREGIPIAMGQFDAHLGAVGSGVGPGTHVKIIGTASCDITVAAGDGPAPVIPGICGIVPGSVLPGMHGIEAGQSAVGDLLGWWTRAVGIDHAELERQVADDRPGAAGLLALDWNNGNRTVLVDPLLTGLILGQTLHTTVAEIYRALVEATAYGAKVILDRIKDGGVTIERVVCCGGIAEKNDMFMQIYADVLGMPMLTAGSKQTPALGSAISAAVAAGVHPDFASAQAAMTRLGTRAFHPRPDAQAVYAELYGMYCELHDAFGAVQGTATDLPTLMKRLLALRERSAA